MKNRILIPLFGCAALASAVGCATKSESEPAVKAAEPQTATAGAVAQIETFDEAFRRHLAAVRKWSVHSFPAQAVAGVPAAMEFVAAHADDHGHAAQLNELKYRMLESLARGRDYATGVAYAEELYALEKVDWTYRALAAEYLAMGFVDAKKDYAAADAIYARLAAPELEKPSNGWLLSTMVAKRAYLYTLRGDQKGAIAFVDGERAKIPGNDGFKRMVNGQIDEVAAAKVFEDFFDYRGEIDYFLARGNLYLAFRVLNRSKVSDVALADRLAREIVGSDACTPGQRTEAWLWLWSRDEAFCRASLNRCFDQTAASTNRFAAAVANVLGRANLGEVYGTQAPAYYRNPELTVKTWEVYRPLAKAMKMPVDFKAAQYAALAYAECGEKAKAIAAATDGLSNDKLRPEESFELKLMAAILAMKGTPDQIAAAMKTAVADLGKGLSAKDLKQRLERAGSIAVVSGDDALARGVSAYYLDEVRATLPKRSYTVRFSDRDIAGAGDWVNLPFKPEESDFTRKYGGGGMSFMTTDVATGDRGNAVQGGAKARTYPTTLQVAADAWGVHFLYTFYDPRARQFESGELDAGSFESYLAPGEGQPYVCFLSRALKDVRGHVMNTTYDSPGHRRVRPNDPFKYRSDTIFTDDAVICYSAFSWDTFADHVPADGGEWDFESVFWGPVPSAWNGTESIHGRSTWGKLRFELGEAARVKILRGQLFKAVNAYRAELMPKQVSPDSVQEGVFSHWSDDELGDPAFYAQCLKPLVNELDAVAAQVKVGMSDEAVKDICERYLSRFRDIRFEVARLRAQYLQKGLSSANP